MPFTAPTGRKVVLAGSPVIEEFTVEGVGIKPSLLCKKGTLATQVVVVAAATDKPAGWVGWDAEGAHPAASPALRTTAYTAAKKCPVAYGPGIIVYARLANGQNVVKDQPLVPAADGELAAAANITVTETASTKHVTATAGSFPLGGMIVALAKEDKNCSGGAANIIVESLI